MRHARGMLLALLVVGLVTLGGGWYVLGQPEPQHNHLHAMPPATSQPLARQTAPPPSVVPPLDVSTAEPPARRDEPGRPAATASPLPLPPEAPPPGGRSATPLPTSAPTSTATTPPRPSPTTPVIVPTRPPTATVRPVPPASATPTAPPPVSHRTPEVGAPVQLRIPALGINTTVEHVGLVQGALDVPVNVWDVAWYRLGPRPGDVGNAVIDGHKDSATGPAVFLWLKNLRIGDRVIVRDDKGREHTFEVTEMDSYDLHHAPLMRIFGPSTARNLNLITCSGAWDYQKHIYDQRLVVYTRLIGTT